VREAENMEPRRSASTAGRSPRSEDVTIRKLLGDLADAEVEHDAPRRPVGHGRENLPGQRARARRTQPPAAMFVLRIVQPGLAGLMDGSVSTLAPVFAAAFATGNTWDAFLVGWPPRSAPASPWASPRRCPTTAASPAAAPPDARR
jgi:hypothetical protein